MADFAVNADCPMWNKWSVGLTGEESEQFDFIVYIIATVTLATLSCLLTLTTRTTFPGLLQIQNVDEDLSRRDEAGDESTSRVPGSPAKAYYSAPVSYYSAAGSGVAEVKVILSGFVLHVRMTNIV